MLKHDILTKAGITEETIEQLCRLNCIEIKGSDFHIVDGPTLIRIILNCVENKIDPKGLLIPPVITKFDNALDLLYTFLYDGRTKLAEEIVDMIYEETESEDLLVLKETLTNQPDINEYILKDRIYSNMLTIEGLEKLERRMLIYVTLCEWDKALDLMQELNSVYPHVEHTLFFTNSALLLNAAQELRENRDILSRHDDNSYVGDMSEILKIVLESKDYYRCDEVIANGLRQHPESIEWRIYTAFISQIMEYLKRNEETLTRRTVIDASTGGKLEDIAPAGTVASITKEEIEDVLHPNKDKIDEEKDYYEEYEKAYFEEFDYKKSKKMLQKHLRKMRGMDLPENFDYLMHELNVLIKNEELGVDMYEFKSAYELGLKYIEEEDYKTAIQYLSKAVNSLKIIPSRLLNTLACCYKNLGFFEKAAILYKTAYEDGPIGPNEIEDFMEICCLTGEYHMLPELANLYDEYDPGSNVKVHYMASCGYFHADRFDDAKREIQLCSSILNDQEIPIQFVEERAAIDDAEKGKKTPGFEIDDYVDYEVTDEEEELKEEENLYKKTVAMLGSLEEENDEDAYNDKIIDALTACKVLLIKKEMDTAIDLMYLIEQYLDTPLLEERKQKVYKRVLHNLHEAEVVEEV